MKLLLLIPKSPNDLPLKSVSAAANSADVLAPPAAPPCRLTNDFILATFPPGGIIAFACALIFADSVSKFPIKLGSVLSNAGNPDTDAILAVSKLFKLVAKGLLVAEDIVAVMSVLTPSPSPWLSPEVAISTVGVKGIIYIYPIVTVSDPELIVPTPFCGELF